MSDIASLGAQLTRAVADFPGEMASELAAYAENELGIAERSGAPKRYRVSLDKGAIVYDFAVLPGAAKAALDFLRSNSPVDSGRFRNSHFVLAKGKRLSDPDDIADDATLVFVTNDQPYARKIEVGSRGFHVYAHLWDRAAIALRATYGAALDIGVTFIRLPGAYTLRRDHAGRRWRAPVGGNLSGAVMTYPALRLALKQ